MERTAAADLDRILRGTSRTFYLTLRVAPRAVRRQLGVAYLFCRAADTIADTALLPSARRLELLALYRAQFAGEPPDPAAARALAAEVSAVGDNASALSSREERALLESLEPLIETYLSFTAGDRALVRQLVTTLTRGMEMDLESFPLAAARGGPEGDSPEADAIPQALASDADLDRYCYHVAGCVGEFWTDLAFSHLPALRGWDLAEHRSWGIRFGKGLQMTNVLRDLPRDLRLGRCYLPLDRLSAAGLGPEDLRGGGRMAPLPLRLGPVIHDLLDLTLEHYRAGWRYTISIPRRAPRLRLACAWPLLIGLGTLALLRSRTADLLAGATLKVSRAEVRGLLAGSAVRVLSDRALDAIYRRLEAGAVRARRSQK